MAVMLLVGVGLPEGEAVVVGVEVVPGNVTFFKHQHCNPRPPATAMDWGPLAPWQQPQAIAGQRNS